MSDPFVIVGGDAAGLSAASKFRRENGDESVVVFEKGRWVSYAHCGMPYYVKGDVEDLTDLLSLEPDEIADRGIDLRREHEVTAVDTDRGTVTVESDESRVEQSYGQLLIATGAHAISDPVTGTDRFGVFTMHDMDNAAALRAFLAEPETIDVADVDGPYVDTDLVAQYAGAAPPESAAIVGGGYVGVEMAEALSAHEMDITMFQRGDQLLPPFGSPVGDRVADRLREAGVDLRLGVAAEEITNTGVRTSTETAPAELVLVGVGIGPNTGLIADTSIETNDSGAILVDDYGRTTVDDVYAAGDCATMPHTVTGDTEWVPLGLTANRAGRAIGQTVAGTPTPVGEIAGTAAVKAFDLEAARTGILDADRARKCGFDPVSRTITAGSRSGYYPGAADTAVTLVADRESKRLLGGSIVGADRAAVRIDTIATALEADLAVSEVERLDLAYAPPFSPVWDPVLVAAKVLNGELPSSIDG